MVRETSGRVGAELANWLARKMKRTKFCRTVGRVGTLLTRQEPRDTSGKLEPFSVIVFFRLL